MPYAYLNPCNFQAPDSYNMIKCIFSLSSLLKKQSESKTDNAIKHYAECHHDVPLWVLTNEMSFGLTNSLYKNMPLSVRNDVSRCFADDYRQEYGMRINLTPDLTWKALCNIQELRNTCGHNNRLLNHNFHLALPCLSGLYPDGYDCNSPRRAVYDTYLYMSLFMKEEQFRNLTKAIQKRMKNSLKNKLQSVSYKVILQSLGFPEDLLSELDQ